MILTRVLCKRDGVCNECNKKTVFFWADDRDWIPIEYGYFCLDCGQRLELMLNLAE